MRKHMAMRFAATAALLSSLATAPGVEAARLDLNVAGDDERVVEKLRTTLTTVQIADDDAATADDLLAAARADYRRALAALYDRGYFAPVVSIKVDGQEASTISPFATAREVRVITIDVQPGKRFTFGRATLKPLPRDVTAPDYFQPGQTATLGRMKDAAAHGTEAWRQIGHAKAELARQQITANQAKAQINAELTLDPGPRLRFGDLRITGTKRLRPERARDIAGLPSGEVFDPDALEVSADRLRRTGVFRSVSLQEAESANADGTLDIEAELLERKPRRIGFGAELSSLDGARVSAFWLHRNLLGGAERFRIEGEVSDIGVSLDGIDYRLGASFRRPATFRPDQTLELSAEIARIDDPLYSEDRATARAALERRISDQLTVSLGVEIIRARSTDTFGTRDFLLLALPAEAEYDLRDNALDPTSGYYIAAGITPFVGAENVGAGLRLTADARAYRGFGLDNRFVLAGRLQLGSVMGPDLDNTPPEYLFYSGGGGTVRGHAFQSLGVPVNGGESGGRSLLVASGEVRAKVREKIGLVGFYDVGFISADPTPGVDAQYHAGAGVGLRYATGFGPIRLDVATPVSGDDAYQRAELYVGIGQSF